VASPAAGGKAASDEIVDEIRVPTTLAFTRNHFWYDESGDGWWHVGIDDFFARLLGEVEQVTFVTMRGIEQPTVLLQIQGMELTGMFPGRLAINGTNRGLRISPQTIVSHPYTNGWLFEGKCEPRITSPPLVRGGKAVEWMREETHKLSDFVQQLGGGHGVRLAADGGVPVSGLFRHLEREQVLLLVNKFFHPLQDWSTPKP
jgi:glycine cleavage system H lipoate-binding protein